LQEEYTSSKDEDHADEIQYHFHKCKGPRHREHF
jgi:hypothetical protein